MDPTRTVGSVVRDDDNKSSRTQRYSAHILGLTAAANANANGRPSFDDADLEASEISIREEDNVVVAAESVHGDHLPVPSIIQMPSSDDNSVMTRTSDCTVSCTTEAATLDSQQLSFLTRQTTNFNNNGAHHRFRAPQQHHQGSLSSSCAAPAAGETWAACDLATSSVASAAAAAPQQNTTTTTNNIASNHNAEAAVSEERLWQRLEEMIHQATALQNPSLSSIPPPSGRATSSSSHHGYDIPQPSVYHSNNNTHHRFHHSSPLPPLHEAWRSEFPYHQHPNHYHHHIQRPSFQMPQYAGELEEPMSQWHHHPSLHQQHGRQISSALPSFGGYPTHHHHHQHTPTSPHTMPELFHPDYLRASNATHVGGDHHRYSWSESVPHGQPPQVPPLSARYSSWSESVPHAQHPQAPPPISARHEQQPQAHPLSTRHEQQPQAHPLSARHEQQPQPHPLSTRHEQQPQAPPLSARHEQHPQAPPPLVARHEQQPQAHPLSAWHEQQPQAPPLSTRYSLSESVPHGTHPKAPPVSTPGNHHHPAPVMMTGNHNNDNNHVAVVVPPPVIVPTTTTTTTTADTWNDRDVNKTLADLLREQAQRRARIGWAEQRRYPREPEILESEQQPYQHADNAAHGMAVRERLSILGEEHRPSRPEIQQQQPPRERVEGGRQDMPEPPANNVLSHSIQKAGRCRDPPESRNTNPHMVAPDPPVVSPPPSPLPSPSSSLPNNSDVKAANPWDADDVQVNVALVLNDMEEERLEISNVFANDARISPKEESAKKSSDMANMKQDLGRRSQSDKTNIMVNPGTTIGEKKSATTTPTTTTKTADKDSKTPKLQQQKSSVLAPPAPPATTTTSRNAIQGPVRNPPGDGHGNRLSTTTTCTDDDDDEERSTSVFPEDWNPQGPIPAALLRLHGLEYDWTTTTTTTRRDADAATDDLQVSVDILPGTAVNLPGAFSVPGIQPEEEVDIDASSSSLRGDSVVTTTTTTTNDERRRMVDGVDSHLVSATLVEESEIETMNFLRQLRQDLDQVVQHLHKEQQPQPPPLEEVTRRKKWFTPLRGLIPPRRRKATGVP